YQNFVASTMMSAPSQSAIALPKKAPTWVVGSARRYKTIQRIRTAPMLRLKPCRSGIARSHRGVRLLRDGLDRQRDSHLVTHQKAARFQRRVPVETEVLPIERDARFEARPHVAPRILRGAEVGNRQRDLPGNAADRQFA